MRDTLTMYGMPAKTINGGAAGADYLAWYWSGRFGIPCTVYKAEWDRQGKQAGPIRNQKMLDEGKPDLCIAFPGGVGTIDMLFRALKAGVRCCIVRENGDVVTVDIPLDKDAIKVEMEVEPTGDR